MWNARLDDSQAGIKIPGKNTNNLRYADDITLMAESEEELKEPFDEGERGEWNTWLKTYIQKTKMGIRSHHFMANRWEKEETWQILFFWAPKSLWIMNASMQLNDICSLEEKLWQT